MQEKEERLRQEIMKDARRKAERTLERARSDVEKQKAKIRRRQEKNRKQAMDEAKTRAEEQYRSVTARVQHEKLKRWLQRREEVLEELFAAVLEDVGNEEQIDRRNSLSQLIREAIASVGPGRFVVRVCPTDKPMITREWLKSVAGQALETDSEQIRLEVQADPRVKDGVIVESEDGDRYFDNTCETRLRRMKSDLRTELCAACAADTM